MQISIYDLYKEAPIVIIDDQEWDMVYVKPDEGNAYTNPVIEFEKHDQTYLPLYADLQDTVNLDDEGKGVISLKDIHDWDDATRLLSIHAMLTVPFNSVNRAKRSIGAL